MKEIVFATTNSGKFNSAQRVLKKYKINVIQADFDLPESQDSLEAIALLKARFAFAKLKKPVIALDAGFFIHSLNGFPMMYVKPVLQTIGIAGILKLTRRKKRECEFREILCYVDSTMSNKHRYFVRTVKGVLAHKPSGKMHPKHWSDLALIFIPEKFTKTMAAMDEAEYAKFRLGVENDSHFEQFGKFYSELK